MATYTDAFCALNAPAPLLRILAADIVLSMVRPVEVLVTNEVGVMGGGTRHRASWKRGYGGGVGGGGRAAVGVRRAEKL